MNGSSGGGQTEYWEVAVLGGGAMGAATALVLARQGHRVVLVDRFEPGHAHGSSHGDGRIIRFTYAEPIYVEMARRAYAAWAEIERSSGATLVETTGSWECGPDDSPPLAELEATLDGAGIAYERWTAAESVRRMPHFHLPEGSAAIYQQDGGILRAARAVEVLRRLAAAAGATVRSSWSVETVELDDGRVRLRGDGTIEADALVVAAGGWAPELFEQLGLDVPLAVTREQVAYFPVRAASSVDHRLGAMPTMIDYHDAEQPFYSLPQVDVPGVKVGWHHSGRELGRDELDPERRPPWDEDNLATVCDFVRRRFPHLEAQPRERVSCLYTNTPDYHFVLDRHPDEPRVAVASGFSGHGFKFAPVVGEILAALVRGETPPVDLEPFRLARFAAGRLERRKTA